MAHRVGLLTAGGDAAGLNVCLKAIVNGAVDRGFEVVGIRKGWEGLLRIDPRSPSSQAEHAMVLTKPRVRDIDRTAGSFLHSSRVNPSSVSPHWLPAFAQVDRSSARMVDMTDHIKRVIEQLHLEVVVLLGDSYSLEYAARLDREGVPIIAIPKSVHNDVSGSDYCLGFSTALASGVRFVHEVRAMAGSREEVAVVETFGRTNGLTTMLISTLASADRLLIPEVPFDPERLAALLLDDKRLNPNNYAILGMSEAVSIDPAKASNYNPELARRAGARRPALASAQGDGADGPEDAFMIAGERAVGLGAAGGGAVVTEILENLLGERVLFQPLSYLLRVGQPDGQDLLGAMNFAYRAVELLTGGKTGRLIAYRRGENYVDVPLEVVTQPGGTLDVAEYYDAARYLAKPGVMWAARV